MHSSPSPTPYAATRSSYVVEFGFPIRRCVFLHLRKVILQSLRFPLTSLCPCTTWSWDQFDHPRCARSLRDGVPKDPNFTVAFTPVNRTGSCPEYCCWVVTFSLFSAKLNSVSGLFPPRCISMKVISLELWPVRLPCVLVVLADAARTSCLKGTDDLVH